MVPRLRAVLRRIVLRLPLFGQRGSGLAIVLAWLGMQLFLSYSSGFCQSITIGVPQFVESTTLLYSQEPAAMLLRESVTEPLINTRPARGEGLRVLWDFKLRLAEQVKVDTNNQRIDLKIRDNAQFSNGRPLTIEDVLYSIEQCRSNSRFDNRFTVSWKGSGRAAGRDWLSVYFGSVANTDPAVVLEEISGCPVIERRSALIFGQHLFSGTNTVGSGRYQVVDFIPGKELLLQRAVGELQEGPKEIRVKRINENRHAITALRAGELDAFISYNQAVEGVAEKDETLEASRCSIYYVVFRRGLTLRCDPQLDVAALGYHY